MSASSIVMNCDDLRTQIFSYNHTVPDCCDDCYCVNKNRNTKLYLYKSSKQKFNGSDYDNSDDFETYLQSADKPSVEITNRWYCNECFRKVVGSNYDVKISNKIYNELKKQNPLMEHKKLLKQKEKYFDMVLYDDYETKYRIKKTNELVVFFRDMLVDVAIQGFKEKKEKDENELNEKIEKKRERFITEKKRICRENATMFVKEMLMRKINKIFYNKKINMELFVISVETINGLSEYNFTLELVYLATEIIRKYRYRHIGYFDNETIHYDFEKEFDY